MIGWWILGSQILAASTFLPERFLSLQRIVFNLYYYTILPSVFFFFFFFFGFFFFGFFGF